MLTVSMFGVYDSFNRLRTGIDAKPKGRLDPENAARISQPWRGCSEFQFLTGGNLCLD